MRRYDRISNSRLATLSGRPAPAVPIANRLIGAASQNIKRPPHVSVRRPRFREVRPRLRRGADCAGVKGGYGGADLKIIRRFPVSRGNRNGEWGQNWDSHFHARRFGLS